jgi:hypothetical protein
VDPIRFSQRIRYWDPAKGAGLAVMDLPDTAIERLGGLRQQRVRGTIRGVEFSSNVMPAGGGRLALSVSKAMLTAAAAGVGDEVEILISGVGRE